MNNIDTVYDIIGYRFKDANIINIALTHISYANENSVESYERLEFLGDAIIEMVVSDFIYKFKELDAGTLTKLRASLVSTENLSKISTMLTIMQSVKKSKSLSVFSKKTMADIFESLIGAIYLDGGLSEAKKVIEKFVIVDKKHINNMLKISIDYKTKFQEEMQSKGLSFEYKIINSTGLDHDKTFECGLYIQGELKTKAVGKSIQESEELCAKKYFESN